MPVATIMRVGLLTSSFRTYLLANSPGWILVAILMWVGTRYFELPGWIGSLVVALWIAKDLLTYPFMRHYYSSQPSERRIVGEHGTALTNLHGHGFVRVHGEIWQAQRVRSSDVDVVEGTHVRVRDVRGLLLFVEPE